MWNAGYEIPTIIIYDFRALVTLDNAISAVLYSNFSFYLIFNFSILIYLNCIKFPVINNNYLM